MRPTAVSWPSLLAFREVWGLVGAKFLTDAAWFFYIAWLPKYLYDARHFDVKQVGAYAWVPYAASGVGSLLGGWLSSALIRRGRSIDFSRKLALGLSALVMPGIVFVTRVPVDWALAIFSLAFFGQQSWSTLVMIVPTDLFARRVVASVAGLVGFGGAMGGLLMNVAAGRLLDAGFTYGNVFAIVGTLHVIAFGVILVAIRIPDVRGSHYCLKTNAASTLAARRVGASTASAAAASRMRGRSGERDRVMWRHAEEHGGYNHATREHSRASSEASPRTTGLQAVPHQQAQQIARLRADRDADAHLARTLTDDRCSQAVETDDAQDDGDDADETSEAGQHAGSRPLPAAGPAATLVMLISARGSIARKRWLACWTIPVVPGATRTISRAKISLPGIEWFVDREGTASCSRAVIASATTPMMTGLGAGIRLSSPAPLSAEAGFPAGSIWPSGD